MMSSILAFSSELAVVSGIQGCGGFWDREERKGRVIAIVHTEREECIRIISARKATKNEQRIYFGQISN